MDLNNLRKEIDQIDEELIEVLSSRFMKVSKIADVKTSQGDEAFDESRWQEVLEKVKEYAKSKGLSEEFIEKLYNVIHDEALRIEEDQIQF
ncbi:MAG TPA: chorismate mutase [Candidatus Dojkabacteria bacterium]|jgi:chorismate mutase